MKYEQYQFKFYLNASHAILLNGKMGQTHPHTWEISIITLKMSDKFVVFNSVETAVDKMFDRYQTKVLNMIPPFDMINPTLENICEVFKDNICKILEDKDWKLLQIEVSETPARSYVINLSEQLYHFEVTKTEKIDTKKREALITEILGEYHSRKTAGSDKK